MKILFNGLTINELLPTYVDNPLPTQKFQVCGTPDSVMEK